MSRNSSNALTNERSYVYSYDKLARYTRANYAERPSGGGSGSFTTNVDGFDENGISYDAGGNILTLKRNTSTIGASSHTQADNLTYTYDGTVPNKLNSITDLGSATLGFITPNGTSGSYGYDNDGNLTSDPYKGLTIKYNSINMADSIIQSSGNYLSYTYDATGAVVRKQQYSGGAMTTQTDYIGAFVYTTASGTTSLTYITNAEGRLINTGSGTTVTLTPEYIITDDQGNARFSFEDNGTAIVIRQENSYYPLGETYTTSTAGPPTTTPNKKLYNGGSEWQNDFTTLPDYQQTFNRNYDAEIGRFIAVDPMPESAMDMTVYQYAGDNPIMMNDPDGAKNSQVGGNEYGTNHAPTGFYQGPNAFDIQDMLDAYEGYATDYDLAGLYYAGGSYGGGQTSYGTGDIGYDIQFQGGSIGARDAASEGTSFLGGAYYQGGVNSYNVYLGDQGHVFVSKDNTLSTSEFHYAASWYMTPEGSYNMTGISNISAAQAMSILNANQGEGDPIYKLQPRGIRFGQDAIQQDNTPFFLAFGALRALKSIGSVLGIIKNVTVGVDPQEELSNIREMDKYGYDSRLDQQTDTYHNFPRSFDKFIIDNAPWAQRVKDGANWFEYPGTVNGTPGNYQIGINDQGIIFHRNFIPLP